MLGSLITSKTRLRMLIKFFISAANNGYLNGLANEFNESTNSIRKELNNLSGAGYLLKSKENNNIFFEGSIVRLATKYSFSNALSFRVNIEKNEWVAHDVKIYQNNESQEKKNISLYSNFNYEKIQSLFSNLSLKKCDFII